MISAGKRLPRLRTTLDEPIAVACFLTDALECSPALSDRPLRLHIPNREFDKFREWDASTRDAYEWMLSVQTLIQRRLSGYAGDGTPPVRLVGGGRWDVFPDEAPTRTDMRIAADFEVWARPEECVDGGAGGGPCEGTMVIVDGGEAIHPRWNASRPPRVPTAQECGQLRSRDELIQFLESDALADGRGVAWRSGEPHVMSGREVRFVIPINEGEER